jgi:hypothetical protein
VATNIATGVQFSGRAVFGYQYRRFVGLRAFGLLALVAFRFDGPAEMPKPIPFFFVQTLTLFLPLPKEPKIPMPSTPLPGSAADACQQHTTRHDP